MKYTKVDLINEVAKANKISKGQAHEMIEMVMEGLVNVVSNMELNDSFKLSGFIHIDIRELKERGGTHPMTRLPIVKPSKRFPKAKLGIKFTKAVK